MIKKDLVPTKRSKIESPRATIFNKKQESVSTSSTSNIPVNQLAFLEHTIGNQALQRLSKSGSLTLIPKLRVYRQIQAQNMVITHQTGTQYTVPGISAGETEFGATGLPSSLFNKATALDPNQPLTGGFTSSLAIETAFGTGVQASNPGVVGKMIKTAGSRIDPKLKSAIIEIAKDQYILNTLKSYLETDQGKFVAIYDGGHYDAKKPPTIQIGTKNGPQDIRMTLVHELLHYVFDKADTVLGESKDSGGADHPAIEALETRFLIVSLIRSGKPPLDAKIDSKFGKFLKSTDLFPQMEQAIAKNDPVALLGIVNQSAFVTTVVSSGLMPTASSLAIKPGPNDYRYTANQFKDLGFLWAQNAVIVKRAMKTAAMIAKKNALPLSAVFQTWAWKDLMSKFLNSFVTELGKDSKSGVVSLEGKI